MPNSKKNASRKNGQKGGRPKIKPDIKIEIPNITLVILTSSQYGILLKKYGVELLQKALLILDNWLINGGKHSERYVGKNNYAHFRSDGWVINTAKMQYKKH